MVQDYTAPVREYDYAFEYVMEAYEKRFGENGCPDIPIIKKLGNDFIIILVFQRLKVSVRDAVLKPNDKSKIDIIENNVYDTGHTIVRRCM